MPERAVSVRDSHNRGAATTSASASSRGAASRPRRGLYLHRRTTTTEQRIRSPLCEAEQRLASKGIVLAIPSRDCLDERIDDEQSGRGCIKAPPNAAQRLKHALAALTTQCRRSMMSTARSRMASSSIPRIRRRAIRLADTNGRPGQGTQSPVAIWKPSPGP